MNSTVNPPLPTQTPAPVNPTLSLKDIPSSSTNNSISKIFTRILSIIFALFIIFFGIIGLLLFLAQLKNTANILNQLLFHTKYIDTAGIINLLQYFSLRLLTFLNSVLFISSGYLIIRNKPKAKLLLLAAILLFIFQIALNSIFALYNDNELKKSEQAHQKWLESIKTIDKSKVTDLSTIWALKDPKLCKNIKVYAIRHNCITEFKDNSLFTTDYCVDISNEYDKNLCYSDVAEAQKDKKICYTIPDEFRKNYCLTGVAAALKDVSLCDEVTNISNLHNTCILNVGIALRDASYCEKANDQIGKDNCYDNIAFYTHNRNLCDNIPEPNYRQDCINKIK